MRTTPARWLGERWVVDALDARRERSRTVHADEADARRTFARVRSEAAYGDYLAVALTIRGPLRRVRVVDDFVAVGRFAEAY